MWGVPFSLQACERGEEATWVGLRQSRASRVSRSGASALGVCDLFFKESNCSDCVWLGKENTLTGAAEMVIGDGLALILLKFSGVGVEGKGGAMVGKLDGQAYLSHDEDVW